MDFAVCCLWSCGEEFSDDHQTMSHRPFLDAVFFDFDGVIVDALAVKRAAIAALFAPHGGAVQEAVVRYHEAHGGMPRQEKLRHCLEQLAGQPADEAELARLATAFAGQIFQGVLAAPLLPHVQATLQALKKARIPAFVVSGTPEEEMRTVVRHRGLAPYFREVFGSPRPKEEILRQVLQAEYLTPPRCLFIGDALADWRAAHACGLAFLGILLPGRGTPFPTGTVTAPDPGLQRWPHLLGQEFAVV